MSAVEVTGAPQVGDICIVRRTWASRSDPPIHEHQSEITKVSAKRVYLGERQWFALDDPDRSVKPRYLDYDTWVFAIHRPEAK